MVDVTLRRVKGFPLTFEEVDNNFDDLASSANASESALLAADVRLDALEADFSVTTNKIADSAVTTAKIANLAVTTAKIADGNVTTAKIADSAITSAKIADGAIQTADLSDACVSLAKLTTDISSRLGSQGAISGDRNRVINGSCQIVNVATFVAANNTAGYGGPEMFNSVNAGGGGQFTQSQGSLSFGGLTMPTVRQTVNTAITSLATTNRWVGIEHNLEGFNVFDLRGKPIALSFVFNTNVSGTYSVRIGTTAGTIQSYVAVITAVANTPQLVSLPLGVIPSAVTMNNDNTSQLRINIGFLNTGTFQTATINQWQTGDFYSATGATNWGATAGNFIELTNLQLEEGTVATDFIRRSYGVELALTQRYAYLQATTGTQRLNLGAGGIISATSGVCTFSFPAQMRATPTGIITNPTAFRLLGANQGSPVTITLVDANVTSALFAFSGSGLSPSGGVIVQTQDNVTASVLMSARL